MDHQTFFFYDLETSGLNPARDRIMQFAGQRTSLVFEPIGEPVNLLVKMSDDTLPSPNAIMVTGITPQATQADGISEAELASFLMHEVFTPGTIAVGYNNVHFDDEFIRYLFWRNFYDAYEWHWRDGRSRWDLLDVVRMVRALRPAGIEWPLDPDGKPTNRLELITKANGLEHQHAHDALSDVEATIQMAELLQSKQPQMFDYLFSVRDKRELVRLVDAKQRKPFVYTSGQYSSLFEKTTVALPLAANEQGKVLVYDLRYNLDELLAARQAGKTSDDACMADCTGAPTAADGTGTGAGVDAGVTEAGARAGAAEAGARAGVDVTAEAQWREQAQAHPAYFLNQEFPNGDPRPHFYPIFKTMMLNRCPAVAPLGVLEKEQGWARIHLSPEQIKHNLHSLRSHADYVDEVVGQWLATNQQERAPRDADAEGSLYNGFLSDQDARTCGLVRDATARQLVGLNPRFRDSRLKDLYLHYRARNFRQTLSESEAQAWEKYRTQRLNAQAPRFLQELEQIQKQLNTQPDDNKAFLVEELMLWYQSLGSADLEGQE